MFERFTEKARRAFFFARYEASQLGAQEIRAEHMLLGLLREDGQLAEKYLRVPPAGVEDLIEEIKRRLRPRGSFLPSFDLPLSLSARRVISYADEESSRLRHPHTDTEHLLIGVLREEKSPAAEILYRHGLKSEQIRRDLVSFRHDESEAEKKQTPRLSEFGRDLMEAALAGQLDLLVGREKEIERVVQILCRRRKNNPVLIGEPGVGKTAIVEGLAQRIVLGDVPPFLRDKRLIALDLSLIVAGTRYRGQFEERLKSIMQEIIESPHIILFIDEMHTLVGAGAAEGSLDAANILKPALSRGEVQCIGSTTPAEFRKTIEKNRSLERRFQAVKVLPTTEQETIRILEVAKQQYEAFHRVYYTAEAIEAAVYQSQRHVTDRFLPDKAIDTIDEAGAQVKLRQSRRLVTRGRESAEIGYESRFQSNVAEPLAEVTRNDIEEVISRWTGIPATSLKEEEVEKLMRIETELHQRIVSQDRAISALSRAIRRSRSGIKNPNRPVGSFLFLGPTGVGKTEAARSLAEFLFDSDRALIRFDMSEYMEKHAVSKLIGSPPGYVGYEEGGQLTDKIKRNPYSILLLDEIEKAHPDLFNILLQVLDDGILTDSLGNAVDFKNVIIIMTSNIGARFIEKRGHLGFQASSRSQQSVVEEGVMQAVKQTFNPEFVNRLDEIIVFEPLTDDDLFHITGLLVGQLNRMLIRHQFQLQMTDEAKRWIVEKTCADRTYGARPLRRALQKYVEDPLSEALVKGRFKKASVIEVYLDGDSLQYRPLDLEVLHDDLLMSNDASPVA